MARCAAIASMMLAGCVAPAQSIGAIDESGTEGWVSSTTFVSSTGSVESSSSSGSGGEGTQGASTGSAGGCDEPCTAFQDCQQARCIDGECAVSFRDELCEPGQACGPGGCEAMPIDCDDESVLVCEDFESDSFAPQWAGGSIARVGDPVHAGRFAGEVSVEPNERENLQLELDPPVAEGMLAIRSFVQIPDPDFIEQWIILYEVFGSTDAGAQRWSLDLRPQAGLMFVNLLTMPSAVQGNDLLSASQWVCVELRVELSQTDGRVEVRVDDVPVLTNGPGIDTVPVDGIRNVNIGGLGSPAHTSTHTFGIDDIVVARGPIGCDVVSATGSTVERFIGREP